MGVLVVCSLLCGKVSVYSKVGILRRQVYICNAEMFCECFVMICGI